MPKDKKYKIKRPDDGSRGKVRLLLPSGSVTFEKPGDTAVAELPEATVARLRGDGYTVEAEGAKKKKSSKDE